MGICGKVPFASREGGADPRRMAGRSADAVLTLARRHREGSIKGV
jgi:hypothetical protein